MKILKANLPYFRQEIFIGDQIADFAAKTIALKKYDKVLALIDHPIRIVYKKELVRLLGVSGYKDSITVSSGRKNKNYAQAGFLISRILDKKLSRRSCLIAIGGGSTGDLIGFVASVFMRGIDFIQIPTTCMAMMDGIIGKVALNFETNKNAIGSFFSPRFIFCDSDYLKTQTKQAITEGLIEVWKHALLASNTRYIRKIERCLETQELIDPIELIHFSLSVKTFFVEKDPFDINGYHKALSLGHTFANYFEMALGLNHGPAVFYGILLETLLASELGYIGTEKKKSILETATLFERRFGLLRKVQKQMDVLDMIDKIRFDKINCNQTYTFVIPKEKGYKIEQNVSKKTLKLVISKFQMIQL